MHFKHRAIYKMTTSSFNMSTSRKQFSDIKCMERVGFRFFFDVLSFFFLYFCSSKSVGAQNQVIVFIFL